MPLHSPTIHTTFPPVLQLRLKYAVAVGTSHVVCAWLDGLERNLMCFGWTFWGYLNATYLGYIIQCAHVPRFIYIWTYGAQPCVFFTFCHTTKVIYSKNHNLMRTVGFIAVLAAASCWHSKWSKWNILRLMLYGGLLKAIYYVHVSFMFHPRFGTPAREVW